MKRYIEEKVTEAKTEEEAEFCFWPPPECASLCNSAAEGMLKVTHQISLPICQGCRQRIDPQYRFIYTPFKEEGEWQSKEEGR
jgi:hypothetical protein